SENLCRERSRRYLASRRYSTAAPIRTPEKIKASLPRSLTASIRSTSFQSVQITIIVHTLEDGIIKFAGNVGREDRGSRGGDPLRGERVGMSRACPTPPLSNKPSTWRRALFGAVFLSQ